MKPFPILAMAVAGAALAGVLFLRGGGGGSAGYRTAEVSRGDLMVTVKASGTVVPVEVVDVGAQVAGQISAFGTDDKGKPIDYGSEVQQDTVLATIDDSLYRADILQAQAQLQRAQATVEQANAKFALAERDWNRVQRVGSSSKAIAQTSYDAYEAAFRTSKADIAVAAAQVAEAQASVAKAERNLGYCTIKSPVKGVIVDRKVNIGQTVVSSLNAPSLFLIAADLRQMQVLASVNEADIGRVTEGENVTFSVDAFPGETFTGKVRKRRLNASLTQNVVNYIVEIDTDNSSGKLLPYLTANVVFEIAKEPDVLLVPNAALKWRPEGDEQGRGRRQGEERPADSSGAVWVLDGSAPRKVAVTVAASDGVVSGVKAAEALEGKEVIVGREGGDAVAQTSTGNPFAPPTWRRRRN